MARLRICTNPNNTGVLSEFSLTQHTRVIICATLVWSKMATTAQPLASRMKPSEFKIEATGANVYADAGILNCTTFPIHTLTSFSLVLMYG